MKVAHLTSVHSAFDTRIFHRECRTIADAGHEVVLVAPHDRDEVVHGVRIRCLPRIARRYHRMVASSRAVYKIAVAEDAELYHFHDPELIPVGLLLKAKGKRVIYDVHEYYSEVIPHRVPTLIRGFSRWLTHIGAEALPLRLFDQLVFPTTELRNEYADAHRATVLYNYPRLTGGVPEISSGSEKRYDVVFVGTVSPFRMKIMLNVALQLGERRPDFKWLFIGTPPKTIEWAKREYAASLFDRHVEFSGRIPYEELLVRLTSSKVGYNYHPMEKRFRVAVPVKVLEYMLAGVPVVTSAFPELERVLRDGEEIVFPTSNSIDDQCEAIERLLDDNQLAARIGSAGRKAVLDRLNWESAGAPKILAMYQKLVDENKGANFHE